jgi:hypothetical protein
MKPWGGGVFYPRRKRCIRGAADKRKETQRGEIPGQIEERTQIEERNRREIKDADQGKSKQQIQSGTRTAPRHNVRESKCIVNRDCSDD